MKERAYAKINLCLDVVRKRDDGYHELNMIMVPLDFYDVLDIEIADEMSLSSNAGYLPMNEKNSIIKAIEVLREEYGFKENFKIDLMKHIPTQGGLAGGSADGAATIRLLKRLLNLQMNQSKMIELAKKVGADVPFCCINKPSLVSGIGEVLEPFEFNTDFYVLLVKPFKGVSTKVAFESLDFSTAIHPDCVKMISALMNQDYEGIVNSLGNTLEQPAFKMVPSIAKIKQELLELGMDGALMSGSGSTVFALSKNEQLVKEVARKMKVNSNFVRITKILAKNNKSLPNISKKV
ncbi:4-(cytidine 5'-diphospho)-2-C-methyl-D-erythritol kinase [Anaerorhabdus furcosa]|uniref:4-diphosphocytidyl-2-C-methyl-D-erythritol kinase n=1 Tax=Anaerorhabdus furcosa TaxID=118967 RepID=A0A1T4MRW1_9FIRM|nr:4-(cytidine 5'-diphospho)-2-C-methyl-D-erythritol kinase [Anaerorhabdus furcosa]SJZ69789.1 4-diphosphocytidyl-2-C-methyl-D-erythritol kinase [Anaerorhabdus furcosa]